MSLPIYSEIVEKRTFEEIEKEIFLIQKNLFDLRMKKATSQSISPHLFIHKKHRLAQLKFYHASLEKGSPNCD